MKVLYIGGTGQISFDCIHESVKAGHDVYVYNRGHHNAGLPDAITHLAGDIHDDDTYFKLAEHGFDAVCQFHLFSPDEIKRDIGLFAGHCDQYVFISSASAYQKKPTHHVITEETPLINPYWGYSRAKAEMEKLLESQTALPYTIVRPSHTSRDKWTTAMGESDEVVQRMRAGKPALLHGDGTSLWTITLSRDFAPPFVKLLGNDGALNEDFHLTSDNYYMWNEIYKAMARAIGVEDLEIVHVATDTLVRYNPDWSGPLLGDKTWCAIFDNSKIKSVVGDFQCDTTLDEFMRAVAANNDEADQKPRNEKYNQIVDRVIADQLALGA